MPIHMNEFVLMPKGCDPELFNWVEERLESIGLNGKLYSRVIKSVLNSNLDEEEIELKHEHKKLHCDDLLINEILLASMWKGNEDTDDYWIFKKVITDFVSKYKSRDRIDIADVASSNESDASEERYEEAFPSLSDACDEVAWNIPKWKFDIEPIDSLVEPPSLPRFNGPRKVAYGTENKFGSKQIFKGRGKRQRKGLRTLSASRWNSGCNRVDDGDGDIVVPPRGMDFGRKFDDDRRGSMNIMNNNQSSKKVEIFESVSLKLIFPNLYKCAQQSQAERHEDPSTLRIQHNDSSIPVFDRNHVKVLSNDEHLIICNLLTLPFFPEQISASEVTSRAERLGGSRALIPDHPWSSQSNFKDLNNNSLKNGPNNNSETTDNNLSEMKAHNYPQSPLPYFHPDPPSFAPFPWGL